MTNATISVSARRKFCLILVTVVATLILFAATGVNNPAGARPILHPCDYDPGCVRYPSTTRG